jgi:hypothetical protein
MIFLESLFCDSVLGSADPRSQAVMVASAVVGPLPRAKPNGRTTNPTLTTGIQRHPLPGTFQTQSSNPSLPKSHHPRVFRSSQQPKPSA